MKKYIVLLSVILIITAAFTGCSDKNSKPVFASYSYSLAETPVITDKVFRFDEKTNSIELEFEVPEAGYIKMSGYDSTDYKEWPEDEVLTFVDFRDSNGKILYKDIEITYGYADKYLFKAGKITAEITFKNATKEMDQATVSWAFAPEKADAVKIADGKGGAAVADENGVARFTFVAESAGVYNITPTEACISEYDCTFRIENENGENLSGELMIHGTEWISRVVFLPEGSYTVVVSEISAIASCLVKQIGSGENIVFEDKEGLTVPVTFGFTLLNCSERHAKFTADGTAKSLYVVTGGSETYYDSYHSVDVVITDQTGKVVLEETCENLHNIDISEFSGEYTITLIPNGTCVVELLTK